jgi:release factor glutamine methyltransferase
VDQTTLTNWTRALLPKRLARRKKSVPTMDEGNRDDLPPHELVRLQALVSGKGVAETKLGVVFSPEQQARLRQLVEKRRAGEPLQYLEGSVPFGPVEIAVDSRVLIPRPETEYLYELVADLEPPPDVIVDLCTGSGALALAMKYRFPRARVTGTDRSPEALAVAAFNGQRLGLEVEWREGGLFDALPSELKGRVQLLTANPPYIAEKDWQTLPKDVRKEPRMALVAGPTGREVVEQILERLDMWVAVEGSAWIEIGEDQGEVLRANYPVEVFADLAGKDRFLVWRHDR